MGFQIESCPVDLAAAGVHGADNHALSGMAAGQGLQGGDSGARGLMDQRHPLDGGKPDAQPGETAGTGRDGVKVDILGTQPGGFEGGVYHGHEGLTVGQAAVADGLIQQGIVAQKCHRCGAPGGIHGKNIHGIASCQGLAGAYSPLMVMRRSSPPRCWMSMVTGRSRAMMSAQFSLHSTATTAPMSR